MNGVRKALERAREMDRTNSTGNEVHLGKRTGEPTAIPSQPQGSELLPTNEALLAMSYEEFAKADLVLLVRSAVLGDDIALASSHEAARRAPRGKVLWVLDELRELYAGGELDVDMLRTIHRLKKGFGDARVTAKNEGGRRG